MKKLRLFSILAIFCALLAVLILVNPMEAQAATSGIYTYIVSNGEATITDCSSSASGAITIPSTLGCYPVTAIGNDAFSGCTGLTSVTIGNSVTFIGEDAFYYCTGLTSVTIPDSVTTIGEDAFCGCSGLQSVTIPDSVTIICQGAFYKCTGLTSVTIPNSVTAIGYGAFYKCTGMTSVTYCGTVEQWNNISIGEENTSLISASRYYHNYENGSCTICGGTASDATIALFNIDAARMILGNALEFQFGVSTTKMPDTTGYYAIIEKTWADGTTTTKEIPASDWGVMGGYYAIIYDGLAAKEMADAFYVTIYNANGAAVSNAKEDSVRDYVSRAYKSQSATGKTMMVDMLNYGAAAQVHFNYGTSDLANNKLTDAQKATGTATAPEMSNDQVKGTNYSGTRFILESRIQVQLAFKNMTSDMYAIYTYRKADGTAKEVRVEGTDFVIIGGKPAGVELSELVYADARALVNVTLYKADGTVYGTATDSIESCALRSNAAVFVELMKFADSAKAHLYG